MTAPSVSIKDMLVSAGVGSYEDNSDPTLAPITISMMPDNPDTVLAIYDSGGLPPDPRWLLDFPGIVIQVRATDYLDAHNLAYAAKRAILGKYPGVLNGDRFDSITMIGEITPMGRDSKNRIKLTSNYRLIIEPAQAAGDNRLPL